MLRAQDMPRLSLFTPPRVGRVLVLRAVAKIAGISHGGSRQMALSWRCYLSLGSRLPAFRVLDLQLSCKSGWSARRSSLTRLRISAGPGLGMG